MCLGFSNERTRSTAKESELKQTKATTGEVTKKTEEAGESEQESKESDRKCQLSNIFVRDPHGVFLPFQLTVLVVYAYWEIIRAKMSLIYAQAHVNR